jgi:hypothetical protein
MHQTTEPRVSQVDFGLTSIDRAVINYVHERDPDHLRIPILVQEMLAGGLALEKDGALERAVVRLVSVGLLECRGGLLVPTLRTEVIPRARVFKWST